MSHTSLSLKRVCAQCTICGSGSAAQRMRIEQPQIISELTAASSARCAQRASRSSDIRVYLRRPHAHAHVHNRMVASASLSSAVRSIRCSRCCSNTTPIAGGGLKHPVAHIRVTRRRVCMTISSSNVVVVVVVVRRRHHQHNLCDNDKSDASESSEQSHFHSSPQQTALSYSTECRLQRRPLSLDCLGRRGVVGRIRNTIFAQI